MIIGRDVLGQFPFGINYRTKTFTAFPPGYLTKENLNCYFGDYSSKMDVDVMNFRVIPIIAVQTPVVRLPLWCIDVKLGDDSVTSRIGIDTGATVLAISEKHIQRLKLIESIKEDVVTFDGKQEKERYFIGHINVGGKILGILRCIPEEKEYSEFYDGHIGLYLLTKERFIIDPTRMLLFLPKDEQVPLTDPIEFHLD
jgi:hypothetical protein